MGCIHADGGSPNYVCAACEADEVEKSHPVYDAPRPHLNAAVLLQLSWARSMVAVGLAMLATYPDPDEWAKAMSDPEIHQEIAAFAEVVDDIRQLQVGIDPDDLEAFERSVGAHYDRACESVILLAGRLAVDPEDLINFLSRA